MPPTRNGGTGAGFLGSDSTFRHVRQARHQPDTEGHPAFRIGVERDGDGQVNERATVVLYRAFLTQKTSSIEVKEGYFLIPKRTFLTQV